jgi:hypothetical protein
MNNSSQKTLDFLRNVKNTSIRKYYEFRLNSASDPYEILGRKSFYKILFILSHMRSGSSLLTHILNSNPEIIGYGETHTQYASEKDFKTLMFKVYWNIRDLNMNHKYILDKVLHNNKFLEYQFLVSDKIFGIFLIREPQRSLASMLELKPHWSEKDALNYYCERLSKLEEYAKLINNKERSLLIVHDQILNNSEAVFESLKKFLGTQQGFSEKYQIMRTTGQRDVGDWQGNIKAGRIIRTPRKLDNKISQESLEQGIQAFNQCQSVLVQYCTTIT